MTVYLQKNNKVDDTPEYLRYRGETPWPGISYFSWKIVNLKIQDTANVLKFKTSVAWQNGLGKQCRPRLDCF